MSKDSRLKKSSKFMAFVIAIVSGWEGVKLIAWKDTIGTRQPWTVCFGETRGVKPGDAYTLEQCEMMLGDRLIGFEKSIRKCLKNPDKIPNGPYVAYLSLAYNIGAAGFCRSSTRRLANEGRFQESCDKILLHNKARGRVVRGLVNRRAHERKICLEGM